MYNTIVLIVYVAYLIIMSIASFILFCNDKKKAQTGKMRTKEKTLLSSVVFGGAVGGYIGRIVAHHKTDKKYFSFTIYLSILLHDLVLAALVLIAFVL